MPVVPSPAIAARRLVAAFASIGLLVLVIGHAVAIPLPTDATDPAALAAGLAPGHVVVSEVMTGGASASDEFIELYNPTSAALPLDGLEVVYVTSTGATVTRKAAWAVGATGMPAGAHLLIANSAGIFGGMADIVYANGLAAAGGSVALRIQGAAAAVDSVGWGTAASSWLETRAAPAPAASSSLERLPGGPAGSSQDTDDNLADFAIQAIPDPQNSGSPPIVLASPTPTLTVTASPTAEPTIEPTVEPTASESPVATMAPTPTPTPTSAPITIAEARALPDGSSVIVEGVTLTASDFTDGGGYLVDGTAGIAVLLGDGSFARGQLLWVAGTVDDRYAQRTIRSSASQISFLGAASAPLPADADTGSIGEPYEGQLVELTGLIASSATTLSSGIAWDLDDGTGPIRVVIGTATGIDTVGWGRGVGLTVIGIVGQRDSSGSGISGFRVQPRDPADIIIVEPAATPSPTPTPTPEPTPTTRSTPSPVPSPTASATAESPTSSPSSMPAGAPLVSIGETRATAIGTHLRIRGVVTAQSGLLEAGSATVQDSTGAILVRMGSGAGSLSLGQFVELDGTRATKAGMLSLRLTSPPVLLGTQADPTPVRRATGALGEADEARVVIARGVVSTAVSRPRGGAVSFAIDDGSGPIRVTISAHSGAATGSIKRGGWIELRGVLGQQTTGTAPLRGYRLWPRTRADLHLIAAPVAGGGAATGPSTGQPPAGAQPRGAEQGAVVIPRPGLPPILARPHATLPPAGPMTATQPGSAGGHARGEAGLVVSGMGLAAIAGLAAWLGRRRRHEQADAREERRILPPT